MKRYVILAASAAFFAALPLAAQETEKKEFPSPGEIVAMAKLEEWVAIAPSDLLVMDLAHAKKNKPRRVIIQLIPAPFSQGWVGNIRKLAAAKWWDGTSINRVQDNYVVQWGDASEKKALPAGLAVVAEDQYSTQDYTANMKVRIQDLKAAEYPELFDIYSSGTGFEAGWPYATDHENAWPVHCYAMVGVGRNMSPDTGTGAELYTVIGHAPRHLDRNIAVVGRVIEGIEHLSSLPRGTGALGFYEKETQRVPIRSVRLGNEVAGLPPYEYLSTDSERFAAYADSRANRRDPFFIRPAGGADICNIPVPARRAAAK